MLPISLKVCLNQLLHDSTLVNYRIYGGDYTTISIKFDTVNQHSSGDSDNDPTYQKPQVYRRKSQGNIKRDQQRLAQWRSISQQCTPCVTNGAGDTNVSHISAEQIAHSVDNIPEDSGVFNSTTLEQLSPNIDISTQKVLAATQIDNHYMSESYTQTDSPESNDAHTQSDPRANKRSQTKLVTVAKYHKSLQTLQTTFNVSIQTDFAKLNTKLKNKGVSASPDLVNVEVATETDAPVDRHVQTHTPPMVNHSAQVTETYDKNTQTESKKKRKAQNLQAMSDGKSDNVDSTKSNTQCHENQTENESMKDFLVAEFSQLRSKIAAVTTAVT